MAMMAGLKDMLRADMHAAQMARDEGDRDVFSRLGDEFCVSKHAAYKWFERGFPGDWRVEEYDALITAVIRISGGAHTIAYLEGAAKEHARAENCDCEMARCETADVGVAASALVRDVVRALRDGRFTRREQESVEGALGTLEREIAEARAAIRALGEN